MHDGFEAKAYIGTGAGIDEMADIRKIMSGGARFPIGQAMEMSFNPVPTGVSQGGPSP